MSCLVAQIFHHSELRPAIARNSELTAEQATVLSREPRSNIRCGLLENRSVPEEARVSMAKGWLEIANGPDSPFVKNGYWNLVPSHKDARHFYEYSSDGNKYASVYFLNRAEIFLEEVKNHSASHEVRLKRHMLLEFLPIPNRDAHSPWNVWDSKTHRAIDLEGKVGLCIGRSGNDVIVVIDGQEAIIPRDRVKPIKS